MSDFLINLGQNKMAVKAIKTLGLPIPLPQKLRRQKGIEEQALKGQTVVVGSKGSLDSQVRTSVIDAGAQVIDQASVGTQKVNSLIFDATGFTGYEDLQALYDFFHPLVGNLAPSGRVVVIGRPPMNESDPEKAAAAQSLVGFAKSIAKEVGKKGSTAQVIFCQSGAEERLNGPLTFILSPKSAFVSGQIFTVTNQATAATAVPGVSPLTGKKAVVTGAARGIGRAIAECLAGAGAEVYCVDLPNAEENLKALADEIHGKSLPLNITDEDAAEKMLAACGGTLDIIVHNAGVTRDKTLRNMKPEAWKMVQEINLGAIININKKLLENGLSDSGRIVVLSSVGGIAGNFGQTNYAATKAALIGYVNSMAPAVAGRGITINAVAPGFIETRMTQAMPLAVREVGRRFNALSQGGLPLDVAELISFLSTPQASGVTGQVIRACGLNMLGA